MMRYLFPLLLLLASSALADGDDHERAREALERGDVLPLTRILEIAEKDTGGRVIEVDLEHDDGRYLYELELITPDGRLLELELDGATGRILEREFEDD
ncbi:PepSY domain-containing protein [Fodinicurvata fenggangensis]|uniref:PepSY domain-containing protein n=1 Tax=Fodinicurvata fenggangensis TaxID=1121830 RepID=UPI000479BFB0|nr:PepSY domain-containing protein [Fodinicurvata fenggangensis]